MVAGRSLEGFYSLSPTQQYDGMQPRKKVMGDRDPAELTRSELRALFVLGHRIPWQYRSAGLPSVSESYRVGVGSV